jgi:hypothetical protein
MTPSSGVVMSNLIDGITINAMPYLAPVAESSETTQLEFCSLDKPQDLVEEALLALLDPSHPDDHITDDLVNTTLASDDWENEDNAPIAAEDDGEDDDDAPIAGVVEDGPPINLVDWSIEGVEGLEEDALCHMKTFYRMPKEMLRQKDSTSVLLSKDDYNRRVEFGLYLINGGDCRTSAVAGNTTTYKWARKYHVVTTGQESAVLVLRPSKKIGAVDMTAMMLENLQQPTYIERVFSDLVKIH